MKKVIIACLFAGVGVLGFSASEEVEMYAYLYNLAQTHEDQLALLQGMAESKISDAGEFYSDALASLVAGFNNISGANERLYAENQAILLASLIGQEKYADAAPNLWRAYLSFSDPLVKAEALMSLGKVQATQYLPHVVLELTALNNNPPARDPLSRERVAFGAVISLEKYGDISGYLPVYFASKGWYSERVKSQAVRSLRLIAEDPSEPMLVVIQGVGYNYPTRLTALQSMDEAKVSRESKSRTALAAFEVAWGIETTDIREREQLKQIRLLAMKMIRENGCSDKSVYGLLAKSYKQYAEQRTGGDQYETYDAITTLGVLATDDAAKTLSGFLNQLNNNARFGSSNPAKDNDMARRVIPAMGATKQRSARQELMVVNTLGWADAVKRLAQDALNQLQ